MPTFIGVLAFFLSAVVVAIWGQRYRSILSIVLIAYVVRVLTTLSNNYGFALPDSTEDAYGFEHVAWYWAQNGIDEALGYFWTKGGSWFYSNAASILFVYFGRSQLLLQSFSVLAGCYCVILAWKLSLGVWNDPAIARKTAWVVALYPLQLLYSALTMREVFITLLILLIMIYVVRWTRSHENKHAAIIIILSMSGILLHPSVLFGIFLFAIILLVHAYKELKIKIVDGKLPFLSVYILMFGVGGIVYLSGVNLLELVGYTHALEREMKALGGLEGFTTWLNMYKVNTVKGDASFPIWMLSESLFGFIIMVFPGYIYFLFSPFPWDVGSLGQSIGLIDSMFHLFLAILIWNYRKNIFENKYALVIMIFFVLYSVLYSLGTGNYGTAIRHRSALLPLLVVVCMPFLDSFWAYIKKEFYFEG